MHTHELWCGYVYMFLEETDSLDDIFIFLPYKENVKVFSIVTEPLYILLSHALQTVVFMILKPHLSFDCRHSMNVLNFLTSNTVEHLFPVLFSLVYLL